MELKGLFYPFTDTGESSLLPPLPWTYTSNAIAAEFRADPDQLVKLLPDGLKLLDDICSVYFFDWQSCADDEGYLDPIRSQYRETFLLISVDYKGKEGGYCPFIWVDNDVSMMRGLLQGYPKQYGSIWVTRPYPLPGKASPVIGPGGKFAGTCSAKDNRLMNLKVELKEKAEYFPNKGLTNVINRMVIPNIGQKEYGSTLVDLFVAKSVTSDAEIGNIYRGDACFEVFDNYYPELSYFKPVEMKAGYFFSMCFTLEGVVYEDAGI